MLYIDVTEEAEQNKLFTEHIPPSFHARIFHMVNPLSAFQDFYLIIDAGPVLISQILPNQDANKKPIALTETLDLFFDKAQSLTKTQEEKIRRLHDNDRKLVTQAAKLFINTTSSLTYDSKVYENRINYYSGYPETVVDAFIDVMMETKDLQLAVNASFYDFYKVSSSMQSFGKDLQEETPYEWMKSLYGSSPHTSFKDIEGRWSKEFRPFLRTGKKYANI